MEIYLNKMLIANIRKQKRGINIVQNMTSFEGFSVLAIVDHPNRTKSSRAILVKGGLQI